MNLRKSFGFVREIFASFVSDGNLMGALLNMSFADVFLGVLAYDAC